MLLIISIRPTKLPSRANGTVDDGLGLERTCALRARSSGRSVKGEELHRMMGLSPTETSGNHCRCILLKLPQFIQGTLISRSVPAIKFDDLGMVRMERNLIFHRIRQLLDGRVSGDRCNVVAGTTPSLLLAVL